MTRKIAALTMVLAASALAQSRFLVGACTHFGQGQGVLAANLGLIKQAGIAAIRDDMSWGAIER